MKASLICWITVSCVAAASVGCQKREEPVDDSLPRVAQSASASSAASSAPAAPLPPVADRELSAGKIAGESIWLPAFKLVRLPGDAGLTWLEAHALCSSEGREVCTEAQWRRACGEDEAIGKSESWTMTFDGKHGFVVRGGNSCATRTVSPGFEKSPARGALCCEPAIAIKTSNSHPAFLKAVSAKLAKLEKAINDRSASSFSDLCDDELEFYGKSSLSRNRVESLVAGSFRQWPDQWVVHDVCNVSLQLRGGPDDDTWTAECSKLAYRAGEVAGTITKYVFGSRETKLQSVTEPRLPRNWSPP
ncbi:MAG TPA: hypothetical protein PLJ27_17285 [Polyangiaceae bacterium]|nr:MAG: hypothetical protein BWY17_03412 [Deltaproteobacteria bacterium ADurb.Bin207]HNS98682.1 hypothetical protein [Polyangiaceae bacterium]HNZ24920.1 hypothetical protein [Polyangiaceae bacterium]HOD24632.1 hypothetical protein [Polyangiaceae bacterium]HOE50491.1 hypothetical protein [Polyangiaceae bacterium]